MFSFRLLFGLLGSLAAASQSPAALEIRTESGPGRVLQCTAQQKEGVQYSSVRWYKVLEPPSSRLSGLVIRDLPDGVTRWYLNVTQDVKLLGDFHSLFLPNVMCSDAGLYMCHLAAPVGEQNRDGMVLLTVTDCATEREPSDFWLLCVASGVLMFALLIFFMSYSSLKNALKEKHKATKKEVLLNAPLGKMDLMMERLKSQQGHREGALSLDRPEVDSTDSGQDGALRIRMWPGPDGSTCSTAQCV